MRFVLIPVVNSLPVLRARLEHARDNVLDAGAEERRELVELATHFVELSAPLLRYAEALGGRPEEN